MPEYEFVVSGGVPTPANAAIRSHAIRSGMEVRSRNGTVDHAKPDSRAEAGTAASQTTVRLRNNLKGRFRLATANTARSKKARPGSGGQRLGREGASEDVAADVQRFANASVDPFDALPVSSNSAVDTLVKYFLTRFSLNMTREDRERPWFGYAMSEPLIMKATLALSAAFWGAGSSALSPVVQREGLLQKTELIQAVSTKLVGRPQISDALIAAVASLGNVSAVEGNFQEADMHMKALQRLVATRGDVLVFQDKPLVARAINWADIQTAAGVGRSAIFPLIHGMERMTLSQDLLAEAAGLPLDLAGLVGQGAETIRRIFVPLRQAAVCRLKGLGGPNEIRILLNIAEIEILGHLHDQPASTEEACSKLVILASHVLLVAGMRQLPWRGPLVIILLRRLQRELSKWYMDLHSREEYRECGLWILFVGAVVAERDPTTPGSSFSLHMRTLAGRLKIQNKSQMEHHLRKFVWDEGFCRNFLDLWWDLHRADSSDGKIYKENR